MGNGNSKKQLKCYQQLISMGFPEDTSWTTSNKYPKNVTKAANFIIESTAVDEDDPLKTPEIKSNNDENILIDKGNIETITNDEPNTVTENQQQANFTNFTNEDNPSKTLEIKSNNDNISSTEKRDTATDCNANNVTECPYFYQFQQAIKSNQAHDIQFIQSSKLDIKSILNEFIHFVIFHDSDEDFALFLQSVKFL
eukprot:234967_1